MISKLMYKYEKTTDVKPECIKDKNLVYNDKFIESDVYELVLEIE